VRRRPADPVVTFIAADGARTELSARTLANNVAKAANAIADHAGHGARIATHLPWHWQRAVWALACWTADATVVPGGNPADADLVIAGPDEARTLTGSPDLWVVSLHPLGLAQPVPAGSQAAATIAMTQPDALITPPVGDVPALDGRLQADLLSAAGARRVPSRFAVVGDPSDPVDAWLLPTMVPLACDASIVMIAPEVDIERAVAAEGATLLS